MKVEVPEASSVDLSLESPNEAVLSNSKLSDLAESAPEHYSIAARYRFMVASALVGFDLLSALAISRLSPVGSSNILTTIMVVGMLVLTFRALGLYSTRSSADLVGITRGILALGIVLLPCTAAVAWIAEGTTVASRIAIGTMCGFGVAILGRLACVALAPHVSEWLIERVLLVSREELRENKAHTLCLSKQRVKVTKQLIINDEQPIISAETSSGPSSILPITLEAHDHRFDRVVIATAGLGNEQLIEILRRLDGLSLPIHALNRLDTDSRTASSVGASWILRNPPMRLQAMLMKRGFDVVVSLMVLIMFAPLMLTIAILIKLETPGPVIFRQTRLGRNNRSFTVLKFRTMRTDAPASDGSVQAVRGDARVTKVGGLLRKTSLDELPQLFNVLAGTMSLVGPRPHPTELNHRFNPLIESYAARHCIAPGITGWAQVNGFRGETTTIDQMRRRVDLDLHYIENYSVSFDLWILLRTAISVFSMHNAY